MSDNADVKVHKNRRGKVVSVQLSPDQLDRLDRLATTPVGTISLSSVLRQAINEFLDRSEKQNVLPLPLDRRGG